MKNKPTGISAEWLKKAENTNSQQIESFFKLSSVAFKNSHLSIKDIQKAVKGVRKISPSRFKS